MTITSLDVVGERIPFTDSFPVSYEADRETEHVFVRLETEASGVGYGEGTALPWFTGETTESMVAVVERYLEPRVVGEPLESAEAAVRTVARSFPNAPGATAAVEMALLDLRGKSGGYPLSALFGPRVREAVPRTYIVPAIEPERAAQKAEGAADRGHRAFKVKADGDREGDAERINVVLEAIPDDATLRVDPNTAWVNAPTATNALALVDDVDRLEYLEQPVPPGRPGDLRAIWESTGVPVFADEAVHGPADVERLGADGAVAGCHLKLAKAGSLRDLGEMTRVAARHGLAVTVASAFGSSLDVAANLHVAAVADSLSRGCELCTDLIASDPVDEPLELGPEVAVPTGPGLGVSLDETLFE